jgi:methyl-accepting chemotaxis protein
MQAEHLRISASSHHREKGNVAMRSFANLKIGVRLGFGFGLLITMMIFMVAIGLVRFAQVGEVNTRIIEQDWVKAEAANVINATTRANARRTMELLITTEPARVAQIRQSIDGNKATIDQALATLDRLIYLPEGRTLLTTLQERRKAYVASFGQVAQQLEAGQKEEAIATMNTHTLPALDALQAPINGLNDLQRAIVVSSSAEVRERIESATTLMSVLGLLGVLTGVALAWWITRSITRPLQEAVQIARTVANGDLSATSVGSCFRPCRT